MTVGELINILKEYDKDLKVYNQDSEVGYFNMPKPAIYENFDVNISGSFLKEEVKKGLVF